jgi:hypothetical protein
MLGLGVLDRAVCDSMSTNTCESAIGSQGESKYDCKDCQEQRTAQQGYKKGCWRIQRVVLEGKGLCFGTHVFTTSFSEFGSHVCGGNKYQ